MLYTEGSRMPEILDHVAYLSCELGARPAGTEEEQQAALYISGQFQREAGLPADIEDFNSSSNAEAPYIIIAAATAIAAVLAQFVAVLIAPAVLITIVVAVVLLLEITGHPVFSKAFEHGVSQNVVAYYKPPQSNDESHRRRRKVVLVANYDSGKARIELHPGLVFVLPIVNWTYVAATLLLPILLIMQFIGFIPYGETFPNTVSVVIIIAAVIAAMPLFLGAAHQSAPYNDGANCNASGVAVLLDVATRLGQGLVSEDELVQQQSATIHGQHAAQEAGVVPDGAVVEYAVSGIEEPETVERSPEERLFEAKAALAALTGEPISTKPSYDIAHNLVTLKHQPIVNVSEEALRELRGEIREAFASIPEATVASALAHTEQQHGESAVVLSGESGVPLRDSGLYSVSVATSSDQLNEQLPAESSPAVPVWYKTAQEKAHRIDKGVTSQQRSRYADTFSTSLTDATSQEVVSAVEDQQVTMTDETAGDVEAGGGDVYSTEYNTFIESSSINELEISAEHKTITNELASVALGEDIDDIKEMSSDIEATSGRDSKANPDPGSSVVPLSEIPVFSVDMPTEAFSIPDPSFINDLREQPVCGTDASASNTTSTNQADSSRVHLGFASESFDLVQDCTESTNETLGITPQYKDDSAEGAAHNLLTMLPSLSGATQRTTSSDSATLSQPGGTAKEYDREGLRTILPSLSGSITKQGTFSKEEDTTQNDGAPATRSASTFGTAGMTGAFAPVGEELLKDVDPSDIYVEDADDSDYDEGFTESGAFAGPGYVEMPKTRASRFFGRFRPQSRKKKKLVPESSMAEFLDIEADFDAREAGRARGGWESFRQGNVRTWSDGATHETNDIDSETWQSSVHTDSTWNTDTWKEGVTDESDTSSEQELETSKAVSRDIAQSIKKPRHAHQRWQGSAFSQNRLQSNTENVTEEAVGKSQSGSQVSTDGTASFEPIHHEDEQILQELHQIHKFRHPDIATEVWFVALGSELAGHNGMKKFLDEHGQELHGAIFIDLDGVGSGNLSYIEREGGYRRFTASSRMRRYVNRASADSGVRVQTASLHWSDSTTAYLAAHKILSMHLAGIEGDKVAYAGDADDSFDVVDREKLSRASDFVISILKSI